MKYSKIVSAVALIITSAFVVADDDLEELSTDRLKEFNDNQDQTIQMVICKNQRIPRGYVIVRHLGSVGCPGPVVPPNAWSIKRPGRIETICKVSPIPNNYAITREIGVVGCPGRVTDPNGYVIQRT